MGGWGIMAIKFLEEKEAEEVKQRLEEELKSDPTDEAAEFTELDINWVDNNFCDSSHWEEIKEKAKDNISKSEKDLLFLAQSKEEVKGKPQLIHQTIQRIPILRIVEKVIKVKGEESKWIKKYLFIDDSYDKRYDGKVVSILALDFWVYKIIDDGFEYY